MLPTNGDYSSSAHWNVCVEHSASKGRKSQHKPHEATKTTQQYLSSTLSCFPPCEPPSSTNAADADTWFDARAAWTWTHPHRQHRASRRLEELLLLLDLQELRSADHNIGQVQQKHARGNFREELVDCLSVSIFLRARVTSAFSHPRATCSATLAFVPTGTYCAATPQAFSTCVRREPHHAKSKVVPSKPHSMLPP